MTVNERVVLSVPAGGEFARTVRMTTAELAARAGMNVDDVDDMKLAAEEAFVLACSRAASAEVVFEFTVEPGELELCVGPLPGSCATEGEVEAADRYARFILESTCDEFELIERDGACLVHLVKRAG